MSEDSFISDDYQAPSTGGYTRLENGENRFRILSSPLLVWVVWVDGKPLRLPYDKENKPAKPEGENASVKHAWIMTVYNYQSEAIEVLELDKMSIITPLLNHVRDKDWGHPKKYDIVITRKGSGLNTGYDFVAKPHSEATEQIKQAYFDTPIDLNELLKPNGNPFLSKPTEPVAEQTTTSPAQTQTAPANGDKPF